MNCFFGSKKKVDEGSLPVTDVGSTAGSREQLSVALYSPDLFSPVELQGVERAALDEARGHKARELNDPVA